MSAKAWLLKIAAEVEADPSRWTQGAFARSGKQISEPTSLSATCWCALGFAQRDGVRPPVELAVAINGKPSIYNDSLANAAEFVSWFRGAAELCK